MLQSTCQQGFKLKQSVAIPQQATRMNM